MLLGSKQELACQGQLDCIPIISHNYLLGGLEHFLFFHRLGIIIPTDFHIFQRGRSTTNQLLTDGHQSIFIKIETAVWETCTEYHCTPTKVFLKFSQSLRRPPTVATMAQAIQLAQGPIN